MPIIAGIWMAISNFTRTLITDYAARLIAKGADTMAVMANKIKARYGLSSQDTLPVYNLIRDAQRIRYGATYLNSDRSQADVPSTQFPQRYGPSADAGKYQYTILVTRRNDQTGETTSHSEVVTSATPLSLDSIESDARSGRRQFAHTPSPPAYGSPGQVPTTYTITVQILTAGQIRAS